MKIIENKIKEKKKGKSKKKRERMYTNSFL